MGEGEPVDGSRPGTSSGTPSLWGALFLTLAILAGILWARRGPGARTRETRIYLKLRNACERAGLEVTPGVTPVALLERIAERHAGATAAAERVVDLYLRARYGSEALGPSELREMNLALGTARKILLKHGR